MNPENARDAFRAQLIRALEVYEIPVLQEAPYDIHVAPDYVIHIESHGVYKLWSAGKVVAPFDDLDELCIFILRG
ncbi:MAG: hypothetical protein SF053_11860 [Bacteroidia bacterium]|nr:hypothetical protein [Bacteroidia bacterium]